MKLFTLYLLLITSNVVGQNIFKAIESKDYPGLEKMLKEGTPTAQYNDKGLTPLWMGVFYNDTRR